MKNKKRTAKAVASLSGQKYLNKNLSVNHTNTPFQIGQFKFNSRTTIFTKPEADCRGRSRCYGCLQWPKALASFGIWFRPNLSPICYGLCQKCFRSLQILPPNLQRNFADKCAKNLENALEVKGE